MIALRLPLHLRPEDMSPEACRIRLALHRTMAQLNPNGFRKPQTKRMYRIDVIELLSKELNLRAVPR